MGLSMTITKKNVDYANFSRRAESLILKKNRKKKDFVSKKSFIAEVLVSVTTYFVWLEKNLYHCRNKAVEAKLTKPTIATIILAISNKLKNYIHKAERKFLEEDFRGLAPNKNLFHVSTVYYWVKFLFTVYSSINDRIMNNWQ